MPKIVKDMPNSLSRHEHQIFISYSHREAEVKALRPLIDAIIAELDQRLPLRDGLREWVWFDIDRLREPCYPDLKFRLQDAVRRSARMLAFISPNYERSEWCRLEWDEARQCNVPALPILWKGSPDLFPIERRHWFVDATGYKDPEYLDSPHFHKMIDQIERFILRA